MITIETFYKACRLATGREPNDEQKQVIEALPGEPLFIVAGPGTGKTACLTFRILKLIFVDEIAPKSILVTTFTKKAAAELRSRILDWGFRMVSFLRTYPRSPSEIRKKLGAIDVTQVITGTIDSICEEVLRDFRDPGMMPPILADEYVTQTLLLREGLFDNGRHKDPELDGFLRGVSGGYGFNVGRKAELAKSFWDRRFYDQVEWPSFLRSDPRPEQGGRKVLGDVLDGYSDALKERNLVDFTLLEQEVLDRLRQNKIQEFREQLKVILVDEYQDTNLLQEQIYLELSKAGGGSLTVVGDDDQSLYRFRGATVELFRDFEKRYKLFFKRKPKRIFLRTNYRSTEKLIEFVNDYATLDRAFQVARVLQKPRLLAKKDADKGVPILGMFRKDVETLAADLASFIHKIFRGPGFPVPRGSSIKKNPDGGNVGDCALLCGSPAEYSSSDKERLPLLLRKKLQQLKPSMDVFNPRGEDLTEIKRIRIFGGLLLECLDPGAEVQRGLGWISDEERNVFDDWRNTCLDFIENNPPPGLKQYAIGWASRSEPGKGRRWPKSVPVLELVYGLAHFFPEFHDDPEGQIYLEVFARQVSACETVGRFSGRVVTDPEDDGLSKASVRELIRNFLGPIASGTIKVNEDLMDIFPRDRLPILSVHQSKGLEFPLVIVDVGSDFRGNYSAQAFKRYPSDGGAPHALEDLLRKHSILGLPTRAPRDRAFDDVYRQFFVAYSRAQDVLLLVGLEKSIPEFRVMNVATGWDRSGTNKWRNNLPLLMI